MSRLETMRERLDDLVCSLAAGSWPKGELSAKSIELLAKQFEAMPPKARSYMLALAVLELARRERQRSFAE